MSTRPGPDVCYPTPPSTPPEVLGSIRHITLNGERMQLYSDGTCQPLSPVSDRPMHDASAFDFFNDDSACFDDIPSIKRKGYTLQKSPLGSSLQSKLNSRTDSLISDSFRRRPSLKKSSTGSSTHSTGSLRTPDRFLPKRATIDSAIEAFRANKDPSKLSASEKFLRNDKDSSDAFLRLRRRVTSPEPGALQGSPQRLPMARRTGGPNTIGFRNASGSSAGERHVSLGSTWTVGGLAPRRASISNGRGGLIASGTNAPLYTTNFTATTTQAEDEAENHAGRIAKALDLDRAQRVFDFVDSSSSSRQILTGKRKHEDFDEKTSWNGTEWIHNGSPTMLDAPNLRDDFYCSVLAYSPTCHTLAVGLGSILYLWSEMNGVDELNQGPINGSWLTSLAFSSTQGCKSILAFGRSDGTFTLLSLYDRSLPRFEIQQPCPVACISWKPTTTLRPSKYILNPNLVKTEELLIGDESGNIYCYVVEWPDSWEVDRNGWTGLVTHVATIIVHSQQICGLAWSLDGEHLGTGGNDNLCCLFEASSIFQNEDGDTNQEDFIGYGSGGPVRQWAGRTAVRRFLAGSEKHRWQHGAAVKAIAFCPWFAGLVATGGGSNDKCIHFFHVSSGACLATISVAAQVTSLIWSTTRREIAATFGYAQPEHPYRIAVFSWPGCKQVAAIPWEGEHRALYAISYPGGPNETTNTREGDDTLSRTAREGCIVVAASDESVKFHEVWTAGQKATSGGEGLLGGSDILEGLEGIDKEGEIIR